MISLILGAALTLGNDVVGLTDENQLINHGIESQQEVVYESPAFANNTEYTLKPAAFDLYLKEAASNEKTRLSKSFVVNTQAEMDAAMREIFKSLPSSVSIRTQKMNAKALKSAYNLSIAKIDPDATPVAHGLSNYNSKAVGKILTLTDKTHDKYSIAAVKKAYDEFTTDLAASLKGKNEQETLSNIYDYIYKNFKYNANGSKFMTVGNLAKGEMACNGLSYPSDTLLEKAGIDSVVRQGDSHFWNVATLESGEEVTFDTTSDIVLGEYKATLGLSTKKHIEKTLSIGFYNAKFETGKYHEVKSYQFK